MIRKDYYSDKFSLFESNLRNELFLLFSKIRKSIDSNRVDFAFNQVRWRKWWKGKKRNAS